MGGKEGAIKPNPVNVIFKELGFSSERENLLKFGLPKDNTGKITGYIIR